MLQRLRARPSGAKKVPYKEAVRWRRRGWSGSRHSCDRRGLSNGSVLAGAEKMNKEKLDRRNLFYVRIE
jgi:hypothetical protein